MNRILVVFEWGGVTKTILTIFTISHMVGEAIFFVIWLVPREGGLKGIVLHSYGLAKRLGKMNKA